MNYDKKDEPSFEQFLNLSGSSSNVNSPITAHPPQNGLFSQHGLYQLQQQNLTRPVPGLNTGYDLKKASSRTDLSLEPQIQQTQGRPEDLTLFLDELNSLNSLNSPSNATLFNSLNSPSNATLFNQIQEAGRGSPRYFDIPFVTSTPPQDDTSNSGSQSVHLNTQNSYGVQSNNNELNMLDINNLNTLGNTGNTTQDTRYSDFLRPDFQGSAFHQQRNAQALSDIASSVSNSPFLSPQPYEDDSRSNSGNHNYLEYSLNNGAQESEVDVLSRQLGRLTESNLETNNTILANQSPVMISISAAPEEEVKHNTPSLFSSNKSSRNNTPSHSRASSNSSQFKAGHLGQMLRDTANASTSADYSSSAVDDSDLLRPDDMHSQMRLGRQHRQSRSRSRSRSRSASRERDRSLSANREKMLELASPNAPNKRTQKHPSIHACSLCEKKFTRPYNLKSHLRTHTDERPFVCTVCGKAFARQHDRKRHENLHSGEKRFECRGVLRDGVTEWGCGKKFARTDALGRHFKTEAGKECIRPLVEENERELREKAAREGTEFQTYDFNALPERLFTQFPGLMNPSQSNSGGSDMSDIE